jgi:hypothetical protein
MKPRLPRKIKKRLKPALARKKAVLSILSVVNAQVQTARIAATTGNPPPLKAIAIAQLVMDQVQVLAKVNSESIFDLRKEELEASVKRRRFHVEH